MAEGEVSCDVVEWTVQELAARPRRTPDHTKEIAAFVRLSEQLAEEPDKVLSVLCDVLMDLCDADSVGVSLFASDEPGADFVWPAIAGQWAPYMGGGMPRDASPCGVVVERDAVLLFQNVVENFPASAAASPPIKEILLAPFHQGGQPVGTVWLVRHDVVGTFDTEHQRILTNLSRFAAAAYRVGRVEAAARNAQSRLALTVSNTQIIGLWEWDILRDSVVADERFATLFGVDPQRAAAGAPLSAFTDNIHPDDVARVSGEISAAMDSGHPFVSEYRIVQSDGSFRYVLARGLIERDCAGKPARFPGVIVDLTKLRGTEEALRAAVESNRAIFVGTSAGFLVLAPDAPRFTIIDVNDAYLRDTMTVREQILGRAMFDVFPENPHDPNATNVRDLRASFEGVLTSKQPDAMPRIKYDIRKPDGRFEERWWDPINTPLLDAAGQVTAIIHHATERTDVELAERALRELNGDLERQVIERSRERGLIWQHSFDLLSVIDLEKGTFDSVNPSWKPTLGWTSEEVVGRPYVQFVHPDDVTASEAAFERVRGGDPVLRFENRYRAKDGSWRWLSWVAVPESGKLYSVTRDFTSEKEQSDALEAAEGALRQSQKMEAVGQLTGGIAHDFNNMLAGIIGSLDLIKLRVAAGRSDGIERFMDAATSSANRAAGLTHRLLAFARRQSLDSKPHDLARLIGGMEDMLHRTLGERVRLETHVDPDLWLAMTDANQFENALLNLAINARDAMPDGGQLTIEATNAQLDERYVRDHDDVPAGDYVAIAVSDTGVGMPADVIAKAFDPFFTTKPVGQGTGLGLSMIYGFAKQSGGHIRIYSEIGKGTTVKLFLPRSVRPEELAQTIDVMSVPRGHGESVLVVEDDATVRLLIAEVLEELGYAFHEAAEAQAALKIIASTTPIDLLITDVGLPGLNGRQLAEIARQQRPDLKVLFVTGYAENAAVRSDFLDEGMAMMTKPFAIDALATRVKGLISAP